MLLGHSPVRGQTNCCRCAKTPSRLQHVLACENMAQVCALTCTLISLQHEVTRMLLDTTLGMSWALEACTLSYNSKETLQLSNLQDIIALTHRAQGCCVVQRMCQCQKHCHHALCCLKVWQLLMCHVRFDMLHCGASDFQFHWCVVMLLISH